MYYFTIRSLTYTTFRKLCNGRKCIPPAKNMSIPGMETVQSDHFPFPWEGFLFLGLCSEGLSNFALLSNFPALSTLASLGSVLLLYNCGKWNLLAANETGLHCHSIHGTHFPRLREYIFCIYDFQDRIFLALSWYMPITCEVGTSQMMG